MHWRPKYSRDSLYYHIRVIVVGWRCLGGPPAEAVLIEMQPDAQLTMSEPSGKADTDLGENEPQPRMPPL